MLLFEMSQKLGANLLDDCLLDTVDELTDYLPVAKLFVDPALECAAQLKLDADFANGLPVFTLFDLDLNV
jgi:hypothetical protein